jgi:hypothetical protein
VEFLCSDRQSPIMRSEMDQLFAAPLSEFDRAAEVDCVESAEDYRQRL